MLVAEQLRGKRFLVYGLARTGLSELRFLQRSGADVVAWDEGETAREQASAAIPGLNLADPAGLSLPEFDGVLLSPGVPRNRHPLAARALAEGVPLIGDLELFQWARDSLPPHRVVGITGTNGKSTTTALVHHLLKSAGRPSEVGGNIGLPILDQPPLPAGGTYVLELSSYQIDLCATLAVDIAVYTNLTPDHLDRYHGMEGYAAAKQRLFAMQQPGAHAVIATDDSYTRKAAASLPAHVQLHQVSAAEIRSEDQQRWPSLRGPHNAQNIACAAAVARLLGLDVTEIEAGLASFLGLPHRTQLVRTIGDVLYVDDSKATNVESVAPALAAYTGIHWILGGVPKTEDLGPCMQHLGRVRAAYVIGEAAPMFARLLKPHMPVVEAGTLAVAVEAAAAAARPGETVLLSPACASFDQFRDYEARGNAFRALVERLQP